MDDYYRAREELVAALERDVVGPEDASEVLDDPPISTYVSGILYPLDAGNLAPEDEVDQADDADETTYADPPVSLANTRYPASIGMTFAVDTAQASTIRIEVETARYEPQEDEEGHERWTRIPLRFELPDVDVSTKGQGETALESGLGLYHRIRGGSPGKPTAVTLVLINRRQAPAGKRDAQSYFQVRLRVDAQGIAAFTEREPSAMPLSDRDLESYRLIYRDVRSYAVGHGISVAWEEDLEQGAATEIVTAALPRYELLLADSNPDIPSDGLTMKGLAEGDRPTALAGLTDITDRYAAWIEALDARFSQLPDNLQATAQAHIEDCRTALSRMNAGIAALRDSDDVWRAFQLANRAMLRQRARSAWAAEGRSGEVIEDERHRWRPFQVAFILLNLEGIADGDHPDREILDLLWFPTGGGKTEAYLGLIAFTVLLRRLRRQDAGRGVSVLMRYTLRLLTIQQFERAAALICALEHLRRQESDLGNTAISIGLWVGRDGTPTTVAEARTALDKIRVGTAIEKGSPIQVRACPWCGTKLSHKSYWITKQNPRLVISCRSETCEFKHGLPIHVVDEDIYREQPTLIIATADKFATLPWVKGAHALFGVDDASPPPELIVQDELHLISGPLGTLAGLYEAAIDLLCTEDGIRPKIVASTATIRRAGPQTRALFDRDMRQFPPPGLEANDSFFAVTASKGEKASRLYVGSLAPGTSQSTLMIRTYAALMQTAADLDVVPEVKDPYWTVVGYFNSLRVLGGARIQILDDVRERLRVIASDGEPRQLERQIELTSREPSSAIPGHLEALAVELPDEETLDYVLATNMISVGVDIDRLGLMVVMGQPQATAEYIQATSRVGRRFPGLVLTLYNAGRSRDRSHYESFPTYHAALYRQVESTSVTPFAPRARDRALHAVLLTLARTAVPALRENAAAAEVDEHLAELRVFADAIADRGERVAPGSRAAVREEFESVIDRWRARSHEAPKLVYANPRDAVNSLLVSADRAEGEGLPTPASLRDVDSESNLYPVRM